MNARETARYHRDRMDEAKRRHKQFRWLIIVFGVFVAFIMVGGIIWGVTGRAEQAKACNERGGYYTQDGQCVTGPVVIRG